MHQLSTTLRHNSRQLCAFCSLFFLVFLGISCAAPRLFADSAFLSSHPARITTGYFAIADFDGDQRPDLATVRAERTSRPFTSYSIRLKFSGSPDSALDLVAPRGGLEILARDVNGDAFTDLVVTTATDSHLVAVLVNDGHGKFTVAKPGTFPGIEREPNSRFSAQDSFVAGQSLLPPARGNFDAAALYSVVFGAPIFSSDVPRSAVIRVARDFPHSRSGRSPPFSAISA